MDIPGLSAFLLAQMVGDRTKESYYRLQDVVSEWKLLMAKGVNEFKCQAGWCAGSFYSRSSFNIDDVIGPYHRSLLYHRSTLILTSPCGIPASSSKQIARSCDSSWMSSARRPKRS